MENIKKTDCKNYRQLKKGEIIEEKDECLCDSKLGWMPTNCVVSEAPDPNYSSHRIYRRKLTQ